MCTGINYINGDHYFGRNLDYQIDFPVDIVITPRNYPFKFRHIDDIPAHNAMIGMAITADNYPMYFEAINELGLGMAGLEFVQYAEYFPPEEGKINVASFEIIPFILGKCKSVEEARRELENINITEDNFSEQFPHSPLHWIIGDKEETIVVESTKDGLHVYDNPYGVLTNSPTFDYHMTNLSYYLNITRERPVNRFAPGDPGFKVFSNGMGTIGLPGGMDSISRFIRVAYTKLNSVCDKEELSNVSQFFHLLGSVQQPKGSDEVAPDEYEVTQYSSCGNADKGIFYFTTYFNQNVHAVNMFNEDLDSSELISFTIPKKLDVTMLN